LAEGERTVQAVQTTAGGASAPFVRKFTVDTVPPCLVGCTDPFTMTRPVEGSTVADSTPEFAGAGEPGTTVTVKEGSTQLCSTTVGTGGAWSCSSTRPLDDGHYTVVAVSTDPAGNDSDPITRTFDINTAPEPGQVSIDHPTEDEAVNTANTRFDGRGDAGATVRVTEIRTTGGNQLLCEATVGANGTWACESTVTLPDGEHRVEAIQTTSGGVSDPYVRNFTVDTKPPCLAGDQACAAPFTITTPAEGATVTDSTPEFIGTGEPGTTVTVKEGSTQLCSTTVGTSGAWSCSSTQPLNDGSHTVVGVSTDPAGNPSAPITRQFGVYTDGPPPPPCPEVYDVEKCTPGSLWIDRPSEGQEINTATVKIDGHGLAGATVEVKEGTQVLCTATVANDDTWTCTPTSSFSHGPHRIVATQATPGGTSAGYTRNFEVDLVKPCVKDDPRPSCADDPYAFDITKPAEGDEVNDSTPTFEGIGEPGGTVTVKEGNNVLCSVDVPTTTNGRWTCESQVELPDGEHTVVGTVTDEAGNVSDPVVRHFDVDTVPPCTVNDPRPSCADDPYAFDITKPTEGQEISDNTPVFEGIAEPGATVTVKEGTNVLCSVEVSTNGNWNCESRVELPDGPHTVIGTVTDKAGNVSGPVERNFGVDTVPPCAVGDPRPICTDGRTPVYNITTPAEDQAVSDSTPRFSGTGEALGIVEIRVQNADGTPGQLICSTPVPNSGTWACDASAVLPDGAYTVVGNLTDPAQNKSVDVVRHFTIDTEGPGRCQDVDPTKCTNPNDLRIDRPTENQEVNTPRVIFEGHGEPGATVDVREGDALLCTTTIRQDNTWICTATVSLADGNHVATATQTDRAGNVSDPYVRRFGVDTTVDPPVVTKPTDGEAINNELGQEVAGTAEPDATVTVKDKDTGEVLCTAEANATGGWSCEVPANKRPGDGEHTIVVTAEDPAGNVSRPTEVDYVVDNTAPAVRIVTPASGAGVPGGYPTNPLVVTGTGDTAGDQIVVSDGKGNTCTTQVRSDLTWSCTYNKALPEGPTTITVTATDQAGNTGSDHRNIVIDRTPPDAPKVNEPIDGGSVNDTTPEISGEGDPGDTVKVVDEDGRVLCNDVPVASDGTWSCTSTETLPEGDHELIVTEKDPAGNVSEETTVEVNVDTTAPDKPVVTKPVEGSESTNNQPTVEGTAEPGSTVHVEASNDSTNKCTAQADATGKFSCKLPKPLPEGPAKIVVTAVDAAGNVSEAAEVNFKVDTTGPTKPTVDTEDNKTIDGETDPGVDIVIKDGDGNTICETKSDSNGHYSCTPTKPLKPGDEITVIATDDAGNSTSVTVRVIKVTFAKDSIAKGQEQTAHGYYFQPGEKVHGLWTIGGQVTDLGWQTANASGEVAFSWPIPSDLAEGTYTVRLVGETSGAGAATFTVTKPLVVTGSPVSAPFMTTAGLMALLGTLFILLAWRRRRQEDEAEAGRYVV
jgi:hypothetical protein